MLVDRKHLGWACGSALTLAACGGVFAWHASTSAHAVRAGDRVGLAFGVLALGAMLFAGFLSLRKLMPTRRLGSAQFWLRAHLWVGFLSVPFALFHVGGLRFGGPLETILMVCLTIVAATGAYAVVAQALAPRILTRAVPMETFGDQIPWQCRWMIIECDKHVAAVCGPHSLPFPEPEQTLDPDIGRLLAWHEAKADKEKWLEALPSGSRAFLFRFATFAKSDKWKMSLDGKGLQKEYDLPAQFAGIYHRTIASGAATDAGAATPGALPATPSVDGATPNPLLKPDSDRAAGDKDAVGISGETKRPPVAPSIASRRRPESAPPADAVVPELKPSGNSPPPLASDDALGSSLPAAAAKKKSPLEIMREKQRLKETNPATPAAGEESTSPSSEPSPPNAVDVTPASEAAAPPKKKSPLEIMREKQRLKEAASTPATGGVTSPPPSEPASVPEGYVASPPEATEVSKKKSPLEIMREKQRLKDATAATESSAASADSAPTASPPAAPLQIVREPASAPATAKKPNSDSTSEAPAAKKPPAGGTGRAAGAPGKQPARAASSPAPIPRRDILAAAYRTQIRPFLGVRWIGRSPLADPVGSQRLFSQLRAELPDEIDEYRPLRETLEFLEHCSERRRQFRSIRVMRWWLHGWLLLHIPASILVIVLGVIHAVVALRVVPWFSE